MASSPNQPANTKDVDALVGQAWSEHYRKQDDKAAQMFRDILQKWPDHIDANYGLALSLRALGQKEPALEGFRKAKQLVDAARQTQNDENSRYQMLARMIDQQLSYLSK